MPEYYITWEIELDAETPQEAAKTALDWIINGPCHSFEVKEIDSDSDPVSVNTDDL